MVISPELFIGARAAELNFNTFVLQIINNKKQYEH